MAVARRAAGQRQRPVSGKQTGEHVLDQ
jgi:hypothetical protein